VYSPSFTTRIRAHWPSRMVSNPAPMAYQQLERLPQLISQNLKPALYCSLFASLLIWILATKLIKRQNAVPQRPNTPDLEKPALRKPNTFKAPERPLGVWTPTDFKRPNPPPYPDWDVHKTNPLPYRPFKHGPYHITMGLRTMQWDDWIELDNHYLKFHADKARRIEQMGTTHCRTAPEAMDGAIELLEEL